MGAAGGRDLSDRYRVVTIDLRGHGESDAPMWRYTLDRFADDVHGLLEHLGIARATFVGLSMGGYILFALYRKHPALFQALVLADTRATADTPDAKAARFSMAQIAYRRGASAIADLMLPKLLSPAACEHRADLRDQLRRIITGNQVSGIVGDLMAMEERPDSTPLLRTITVPTLVIAGEEDLASPPEEVEGMAHQIPGSTFVRIPQAGTSFEPGKPRRLQRRAPEFFEIGGKFGFVTILSGYAPLTRPTPSGRFGFVGAGPCACPPRNRPRTWATTGGCPYELGAGSATGLG